MSYSVPREQCAECYENGASFCIHGKPPVHWDVKKQRSKAGDNAEVVKLKFRIQKLKEVLSDANEMLLEEFPKDNKIFTKIRNVLNR